MMNSLNQSRDNQLFRIDQCEERILRRMKQWSENMIEDLFQTEGVERHMNRVTEINLFVDHQRIELDMFDMDTI